MGLAPLIVLLKTLAIRTGNEGYNESARFWTKIFGINFALGVVTGIPMEFQFGTNWAQFSRLAGGVIGQPLAMEGTFSFFLESAFLGLFLYGEKRLGRWDTGGLASWYFLGHGSQGSLSSSPTRGCSIQWPTRACPMEASAFRASGDC
jgi:cytochrome d ubiquinol oxidase subunit I